MRFNTGISAMMEFVNAAVRACSWPMVHRAGLHAVVFCPQHCRILHAAILLVCMGQPHMSMQYHSKTWRQGAQQPAPAACRCRFQ